MAHSPAVGTGFQQAYPKPPLHTILGAARHLPMAGGEHFWQPGRCPSWLEPPLFAGTHESCGIQHCNGISRPRVGRFVT